MFTHSLNDDMRDLLFEAAYMMLTSYTRRKEVRCKDVCEGVVTTRFQRVVAFGTSGILFEAHLETDLGNQDVLYMMRPEDLGLMARGVRGAWLSEDELGQPIPKERLRSNPVVRAAKAYKYN